MGTLYVVGTPIGNLADISARAIAVLQACDLVAAEDTRHARKLLQAHGISARKLTAYHRHNESRRAPDLLRRLAEGDIALITDAGTPAISDPGRLIVAQALQQGLDVRVIPGPSAVIAAASVSGLVEDGFQFLGFVPSRADARRRLYQRLRHEPRTTIVFEVPHRIGASLADAEAVLGPDRRLVLCRELTKIHEQTLGTTVAQVRGHLEEKPDTQRGEMVLIVGGGDPLPGDAGQLDRVLEALLTELPLAQAVRLALSITRFPRNEIYDRALAIQARRPDKEA